MTLIPNLSAPSLLCAGHKNQEQDACASCGLNKLCEPAKLAGAQGPRVGHVVARRHRVARQASLFSIGEQFNKLYAVRFGQFKECAMRPDGLPQIVGFRMAGDLMGCTGIASGRHPFDAIALEDSEVCEISYAMFERVMEGDGRLQRRFLHTLSQRIVDECGRAVYLSELRADRRFARFLLTLSNRYAALGYSGQRFRLTMSRGDIGNYLGITPESVSRLVSKFQAQGWVCICQREVALLDRAGLEALCA